LSSIAQLQAIDCHKQASHSPPYVQGSSKFSAAASPATWIPRGRCRVVDQGGSDLDLGCIPKCRVPDVKTDFVQAQNSPPMPVTKFHPFPTPTTGIPLDER
jgi:hypothetical protein